LFRLVRIKLRPVSGTLNAAVKHRRVGMDLLLSVDKKKALPLAEL
jgi:hypothetical protein